MKKDPKQDAIIPRSFTRFLDNICDGDIEADCAQQLQELITILEEEAEAKGAGKGKLTLSLAISIDARGQVVVGYDVTTKEPKKERAAGICWLDPKGRLVFENPKQQKLPLQEVSRRRHIADDEPDAREVAEV
jgi:hypothetical protein